MDILGIGMSVADSIWRVDAFPNEGGVTEGIEHIQMGGGPVATALCAAAQLGSRVAMIDRIGDDAFGDRIIEDFVRFGVDTSLVQRAGGQTSSHATVLVRASDGERHIIFQQGSAEVLAVDELPLEVLKRAKVLHLNGRHWPACVDAARIVKEAGGLVSFDGGANRFRAELSSLLPLVDVLIVACDFAEQLAESDGREEQLDVLARHGAQVVGVTDGAKGSWFRTGEGEVFHQPALPVEDVVDTTGCGDVFHGAFLSALVMGESMRRCAQIASAAAAWKAGAMGGRGRLATQNELASLLES